MKSLSRSERRGGLVSGKVKRLVLVLLLFVFALCASEGWATTYYVSNLGSDSNSGTSTSAPWRTIAHVKALMAQGFFNPGDSILFARGGIWYEELDLPSGLHGSPGHPITIGNYGSGSLPIIDGGSTRAACIQALNANVSYITVDGFECRNTTEYGINFNAGFALVGIVIENNYVHNTGPGACAGCGTPYDDGHYRNQINFEIDNGSTGVASGVEILNNTVANTGGHNSIQVHHDEGGPLVKGNVVSNCSPHGCIDLKAVVNAVVDSNTITNPNGATAAPAIYTENTFIPQETITEQRNIIYQTPVGIQIESGLSGTSCLNPPCAISANIYNNTLYESSAAYTLIATSCAQAPMSFTVKNNIFDGGSVDLYPQCELQWDYNDDGGSQGFKSFVLGGKNYTSAYGPHDLYHVNPLYVAPPPASPPNFSLQSSSPCLYAGTNIGLPYTGPAPSMGAIDPGEGTSPRPTPSPTPTPSVSSPSTELAYFAAPANGAVVCGTVPITVVDPAGVSWTDVYADGGWIESTNEPSTTFSWNSATVANGTASLSVTSYDANNNKLGSTSINVTVNNPCLAYFAAPANGATVAGTVTIVIEQPPQVSWTDVYVDGGWIASTNQPTTDIQWPSSSVPNGSHTLSVTSYNSTNQELGSNSIVVSVAN